MKTLPILATLLSLFALASLPAHAADPGPPTDLRPAPLKPGRAELLPSDDFEAQDFEHAQRDLITQGRKLQERAAATAKRLADRQDKADPESRRLEEELRGLRVQGSALQARLTDALLEAGVEGPLIACINSAPTGPRHVQRHAYGLVLLLDDLSVPQRALFELVRSHLEGAELVLAGQRERTELAVRQTQLPEEERRALLATFDRQLALVEERFWQLTDFTLGEAQRARLWRWLPRSVKRKAQPVEHLYALPDLGAAQATRLKALFTEVEAESAPDEAALKRMGTALGAKELPAVERQALAAERTAAQSRLATLRRRAARETRAILTDAQWLSFEAIPPRVSANDRRANAQRILEGWQPYAGQARRMRELEASARVAQRELRERVAGLERAQGEYGADSPQMAGMQMEMLGVRSEGERVQREVLGRIFLEVMTPSQVAGWVLGRHGYKR